MENDRDSLGVVIGTRDIYDQLVGVRVDIQRLLTTNEAVKEDISSIREDVADHETRMRSIEKWRYALPTAAVSGLIAASATVARIMGVI